MAVHSGHDIGFRADPDNLPCLSNSRQMSTSAVKRSTLEAGGQRYRHALARWCVASWPARQPPAHVRRAGKARKGRLWQRLGATRDKSCMSPQFRHKNPWRLFLTPSGAIP